MTLRSEAAVAPRTHSLNRAAVVTAALVLIDQDGPQAVTMRAIAGRLGVRAQSLYTHVDSRRDLFDAVADRIVDEIDADLDTGRVASDPWQHFLVGTARAVRRYAHHHPNAFVLLATLPAHADWPLLSQRWSQTTQALLERSGFNLNDAAFACRAFDGFLLGALLLETRELTTQPGKAGRPSQNHLTGQNSYRMPAMQGRSCGTDHQQDEDFTSALDNVIDRIVTRVGRRPTPIQPR